MTDKALLSSVNQEWETPKYVFDFFNRIHNFSLDACATKDNKKVDNFYSIEDDGLSKNWANERVWINPPYCPKRKGKPGQIDWVKKAYEEVKFGDCNEAVLLLPARTDTKLFHEYVMKSCFVFFLRGRLKFVGAQAGAVFPSMVVTFEKKYYNIYSKEAPDPCFTSLRIKEKYEK